MSIRTTRRGLFAFAAAVVGGGSLIAAKPAEAPTPESDVQPGLTAKQAHYRLMVMVELEKAGLDSSLWRVEFDYDPGWMVDSVTLSSTAYGEERLYSKVRNTRPEAEFTSRTADMQVQAMARAVSYIEKEAA